MGGQLTDRGFGLAGTTSMVEFPVPYMGPEYQFYDDFIGTNTGLGSTTADAAIYRIGGTGTNVITAVEDTAGGGGKFVTGGTDNNEFAYQVNGSGVFCRARTATYVPQRVHFSCRFLTDSITAATAYFGLWIKESATTAVLTPITGTQPAGIGFVITNGVVQYEAKSHAAVATTATALGFGSIATATFYNFDMTMDENNNFNFYVNGKLINSINSTSVPLSNTVGLSPCFGIKTTGGSTAKYLVMQRLYCAVEAPKGGR